MSFFFLFWFLFVLEREERRVFENNVYGVFFLVTRGTSFKSSTFYLCLSDGASNLDLFTTVN